MKDVAFTLVLSLLALGLSACTTESSEPATRGGAAADGGGGLPKKSEYATGLEPAALDASLQVDAGGGAVDAHVPDACGDADCSAKTAGCTIGYCDAATGKCKTKPAADNAPCDDGDACTASDVCTAGQCKGTALDCAKLDDDCTVGACDQAAGECVAKPRKDGIKCNDANKCTNGDVCKAGVCTGHTVDCSSAASLCNAGGCDPEQGCVPVPLTGGACDDGDKCTQDDTCDDGTCKGEAIDCSSAAGPCTTAACDPQVGGCTVTQKADNALCDDGDACTTNDACHSHKCQGIAKGCPSVGECQVPTCDPISGNCGSVAALDGISCSDSDACTLGDHCYAGACVGQPKVCPASTCMKSVCQSPSGVCAAETPVTDGTSCDLDAADCRTQKCMGGACKDTAYADCSPCGDVASHFVCDPYMRCGSETLLAKYDFDDGNLDGNRFYSALPSPPWTLAGVTAYSGTYSLESAQIGDSQSSLERFDVMGGSNTTVSFWLYTSSEAATQGKSGDAFIVSVDGLEQKRWTGTTPWLRYTLYLGPGQHTVQLEYTKDASGAAGMDAAFVDDLEIRDEPRSFPLFPALAPLQTSGDQPFIVLAPGTAALTDTLAPGEQALLTLPVAGYARDIAIGAWIDTQLANPDKLEVLVDGNVIYTLDYTSPLGFWPLDVPKGSHTVEWLVTRDASSTGSVNVTVQSVSVIPKACP